jgi:hypothetical protein
MKRRGQAQTRASVFEGIAACTSLRQAVRAGDSTLQKEPYGHLPAKGSRFPSVEQQ